MYHQTRRERQDEMMNGFRKSKYHATDIFVLYSREAERLQRDNPDMEFYKGERYCHPLYGLTVKSKYIVVKRK
jgi:hypothetical protein